MNDSFIHACAGGAGGVLAMTTTYPLMTISTRAAVETSKNPGEPISEAIAKILKQEGVSGLYSGLSSSLIGVGVSNFIYYFFFEKCRDVILTSKNKAAAAAANTTAATILAGGALTTAESMMAGAIAGSATTLIANPIWVVNTRQTVRVNPNSQQPGQKGRVVKKLGFLQTIRHVLNTDGIGAFWKGIGPALVLVINPILQYTAYERLRALVLDGKRKRGALLRLSDFEVFLLGALSKLFATGITYPQIVIKSRQQSGGKSTGNVWTAMTDIVKNEGIAGLYKGIFSKLIQSVLTAALLFASKERIYDATKKALAPVAEVAAQAPAVLSK